MGKVQILHTALLLLLSYTPFLTLCRSIPPPVLSLAARELQTTSIKVQTVHPSSNGYARAATLSNGNILLGYAQYDGEARTLQVLRSTDGGMNFKPWGSIAHRDSNADLDNVFLLEVGSTVLAAFRNHDKDDQGVHTYFRITVCISKDGGKSWEYLSQAVEFSAESSGGMGVWEPFMRVADDGQVHLTYSGELAADNQETFQIISKDGKSWSKPVNLKIHKENEKLRDGMQGIVKVKDGGNGKDALVMVFETTRRGEHQFSVEYAVSYDDGATYVDRGEVYTPPDGKQAGSPQIAKVGNKGGLAVLFMTDESTKTQNWPNIAQVKSLTSAGLNNGKITWSKEPQLVGDGDSHWPGLLGIDGKVFGMYDQNGVVHGEFLDFETI